MSGPNPTLTKSFVAEAAVTKRRIVKVGAADGQVLQAAAVGDAMFGVAADLDAATGERVDVHLAGLVEVELGGTVARGDPLTSDGTGRGVAAAPAAGVNNRIVGFAMVSGVVGDIGAALLAPGRIQG